MHATLDLYFRVVHQSESLMEKFAREKETS